MKTRIIIKDKDKLSKYEMNLMNKFRKIEFGKNEVKNFKKDYPLKTKFFFVKNNKKIIAFGGLMPIKINYLNKNYNIFGICNIISTTKGRGYGKLLTTSIINYLRKNKKTGLGFTKKTGFFKKAGLKTKKDFIKRFVYQNPITKKEIIDNNGDGIYCNGKDNFIKKVLKNKSKVYIDILHW